MRRTYLDAGVLIEAAAGRGAQAEVALALLRDSKRVFLSCPYLDLELLPQVILNGFGGHPKPANDGHLKTGQREN
jgi:hypothetical protein